MIECRQHPQFSLSGQVALVTGAGSKGHVARGYVADLSASHITGQRVVVDGGSGLQERKG